MGRYEVRDDGTGYRWDWLNILNTCWPYEVYEYQEGRWAFTASTYTLRGARRSIRRAEADRRRRDTVVWRENDGERELPDLREWTLARGSETVRGWTMAQDPNPHRVGACPGCGSYRADGRPPYLHHPGCPHEGDLQMNRFLAERQSGDAGGPPLFCTDPAHGHEPPPDIPAVLDKLWGREDDR